MKNQNKKIGKILAFSLALMMLFILSGCDNAVTTIGQEAGKVEEYVFPEGGLVKKNFFDELMGTVNTDVFPGQVENLGYVWTFNGADISEPMDFDISVGLNNDAENEVRAATGSAQVLGFTLADNQSVPGKYNLRLNLPDKWDAKSIDLYALDAANKSLGKVGTVQMDNSGDRTKVNFGLTVAKGQFYLVSSTQDPNAKDMLGMEAVPMTQEEIDAATIAAQSERQNIIAQDSNYSGATDEFGTQLDNSMVKPAPPQDIDTSQTYECTLTVNCANIWLPQYYPFLNKEKEPYQPRDGVIYATKTITYHPGEMVFDVLQREMQASGIQMESSYAPIYGSSYIEGINNLYEFDCGELSGWMYAVNGWTPNFGASRYKIQPGDNIEWHYTCDLGRDLGMGF